jgi:hypothetical protein
MLKNFEFKWASNRKLKVFEQQQYEGNFVVDLEVSRY